MFWLALLVTATPAVGQENPRAVRASLTVVLEKGIELAPVGVRIDLGLVDRLVTATVERTLTLKNEGAEPLTIERVEPSCGCTGAILSSSGGKQGETLLKSGETATLKLSLDMTHQASGKLSKFLWVYRKGSPSPALTIEVDVRTEALVSFSPTTLDFGRCASGAPCSLPLLLTIDKRLAATSAGIPFELVCSSPGIKISPRDGALTAQPDGVEIKAYTLTLAPDANLGLLTGVVSLMVPTPPGTANAAPGGTRERIVALLAATSVALHGEVVGSVSASPAAVVFAVVNAGQSVPRRIALNGSSAEALANLKIYPVSDWISARLLPIENPVSATPSTSPVRILEVSLTKKAPLGSMETQVVVLTGDGKRLVLPVLATIDRVP